MVTLVVRAMRTSQDTQQLLILLQAREPLSMDGSNKRLKIAFLANEAPQSKKSYSGSLYYMGKALEKYCGDVYYLPWVISFERRYMARLMLEVSQRVLKKNIAYDRLFFVAKKQARVVEQSLRDQSFDLIFAPNCTAEIAFLKTTIPIFLALDVTFRLQRDYYPLYSNLLGWSARQADSVEASSYKNAAGLLFSSDWAACSAIRDYGVDASKVHSFAFGANLDNIPSEEQAIAHQRSDNCRLLFMGIGWERKGGAIAYETLLKLEQDFGIRAELIICGSTPPTGMTHERMKVIPFLDKNDPVQSREIEKLYATADFLLLPTRCDCAPNVFKEANAYGVPVITCNTGGISFLVRNGENGFVLPYDARGSDYARVIAGIYFNDQRYRQLVRHSRKAYDERLSWDAWAMDFSNILAKTFSQEICNLAIY